MVKLKQFENDVLKITIHVGDQKTYSILTIRGRKVKGHLSVEKIRERRFAKTIQQFFRSKTFFLSLLFFFLL